MAPAVGKAYKGRRCIFREGLSMPMYHDGNRELQDRFGSRPLADRLVERLWRDRFKDEDKAFIEAYASEAPEDKGANSK